MKVEVEVFRVAEGSTEVTRREKKFVVEVNGTPGVRTWCSEIQHAARERFGIPLEAQHVTTPRLVLFSLIYPCHYGIGSIRLKLMSDEERITEYAKFFDEKEEWGEWIKCATGKSLRKAGVHSKKSNRVYVWTSYLGPVPEKRPAALGAAGGIQLQEGQPSAQSQSSKKRRVEL
ncbi:unnamed protein product [Amoebophrya sp. A120]|nr:unnamed protein product [Amoebophrya sp. A120]|eukprot:GSA120T00009511001.1